MILVFQSGSTPFLVGVGKQRELSIAAPITKYVFTTIDALNDYKALTKSEKDALAETKRLVSEMPSDDSVRSYICAEMEKLGMVYKNDITAEQYLNLFRKKSWV